MDVPAGRQIVFEFNRPVVPLGTMERSSSEIPITIEPALECQWRWLNASNLACQLDERHAMAPATRYNITVRPEIAPEEGPGLSEAVTHSFKTLRPKIASERFKQWLSPAAPLFTVRFNQPVRKESLEAHMWFQAEGGARVAPKVSDDPDYRENKDRPANVVWLLSPTGELPQDTVCTLMVEPGVLSTLGNEPGIENRKVTSFATLPPFRFMGVQCKDPSGTDLVIRPEAQGPNQPRCNPTSSISLMFSSPVRESELSKVIRIVPASKGGGTREEELWPESDYSRLSEYHKKGANYSAALESESIRPFTEYHIQAKANTVKDEFGRMLAKVVDMRFATDHMPPELHLFKNMSVLEKGLDTDLQALATNIDQVEIKYEVLAAGSKSLVRTETLPGPRVQDTAKAMPLRIRKLIGAPSGLIMGNISTRPLVSDKEYRNRWFFAQVTPFDVHVKLGHFNTIVWVTDLQSGQPVPGVGVKIHKGDLTGLSRNPESLAEGETDANGVAELPGTAEMDPSITFEEAFERKKPGLFVWCRKKEDVALIPLRYDFQVDSEGSNHEYIPSAARVLHGHMSSWGATAQGIYKLGDTVQYKIYVRDQENRRFIQPPSAAYGLKVVDPSGKIVFQRDDIKLSEFGAFDGEFLIPGNASVGWYRFQLSADSLKLQQEPMQVLVSDFTPSPFKVTTELNGKIFGVGEKVTVSTQARLHAGGPFGKAKTRITATVETRSFRAEVPTARDFQFDVLDKEENETPPVQKVFETEGQLDDGGNLETPFTIAENPVLYGRLTVESSVSDERGKSVADRADAAYFGRDRYVGLQQSGWVIEEQKPARAEFIVVDQFGNAAPGTETLIKVEKLEIKAARVKEAGDTFPTQYEKEWVELESHTLTSGEEPQSFEFTPQQSGTIRIVAEISDSKGRVHRTTMQRWVTGKSHVLWETQEGNLLNIYPEKEEYRVGDTARFLVQNPFPGCRALVAVERYGVLDRWVKTFDRSTEVIEIPVLPDYLPGFYLSATIMSPRVEKPIGPEGEDLGKPAFRIGYAKIEVKDQYKEIQVQCTADKEEYKPGDTVKLEFQARPKNVESGEKSPPIELAVAVLDEAVFDLLKEKRQAFDPYQGFYHLEDLDLTNYNLIMQLVGREKLEKKGASPAAAAGFDLSMRSVFKFVSFWNPSIRVDEDGKAMVEFQVPDNLTGWRVLAMAVTSDDRMGLGETTFKVNRLTELRPVLPNQVMEGDSFSAGFSVMNRTAETRNIEVKITAAGPCEAPGAEAGSAEKTAPSTTQTIVAEPYKRYVIRLPIKAVAPGEIVLTARGGDEIDRDGMRQNLKVLKRRSSDVAAAYGSLLSGEKTEKIAFPEDMLSGTGQINVTLSPSIIGELSGAFDYMRAYPYECWEQKISRAVMAGLFGNLAPYLPATAKWEGSAAEAEKILAVAAEFQSPNGGMAFYLPKDDYVSPYLSAYTALAFNWLREAGHEPPKQVEENLHKYLQNLLKHEELEKNSPGSILGNVRAVALAALAGSGKISRDDLERNWKFSPDMSLFGKANYLEALTKVPDTAPLQQEVIRDLLAHSDQSSGTFRFSNLGDSAFRAILASPVRDTAAILMAFLSYKSANTAETELGDIPVRIMQGISMSRKGRDHWASTQENLYAAVAALRFSKMYESARPEMTVQVKLDQQALGQTRFDSPTSKPAGFDYPVPDSDRGRKAEVSVGKDGEGRLYYSTKLSYTPGELSENTVNAGIEIHREYSVEREGRWVLLQNPLEIKTGELVRVDLFVSLPAERYFVVVDDPVPGGLEPVNRDLATSSEVDAAKAESRFAADSFLNRYSDWREYGMSRWSFYHLELRHDSARFYSERLGEGHYYLSYTAQAVAPGEFSALPARAEEMYDPDVFGRSSPAVLKVQLAE
jgi:hypothetical protein